MKPLGPTLPKEGTGSAHCGPEGRLQTRVPLGVRAEVSTKMETASGEVRNISAGGAFFVGTPKGVEVGDGLRLDLKLPTGTTLNVTAVVRWKRIEPGLGFGFGLEFLAPGRAEKRALEEFVEAAKRDQSLVAGSASLSEKYVVRGDGVVLTIRLSGALLAEESRELAAQVQRQVSARKVGGLLAYIDVQNLAPCPDVSLPYIKEWLKALGTQKPFYGLVVGKSAIALLQLRRVAREAGIGDSLVCFESESEAKPFFEEIQKELRDA